MKEFIDTLEDLGFYKYCNPELAPSLKQKFLNGAYLFLEDTKRIYPYDYEYLAEGGVKKYLEELLPFLENQGVSVTTIDQKVDYDNLDYRVIIDGNEFIIYLQSELANIDTWGLTTKRTIALVNHLLDNVASKENFFLLTSEGSASRLSIADGAGVFLTQELYDFISNHPLSSKKEIFWLDSSDL
jgi:hypothetical protein